MRKVVVFVSAPDAGPVRDAIELSGAGRLGNLSSTIRQGSYSGSMRSIDEERIEFACDDATYADILNAIDVVSPRYAAVDSWNSDLLSR